MYLCKIWNSNLVKDKKRQLIIDFYPMTDRFQQMVQPYLTSVITCYTNCVSQQNMPRRWENINGETRDAELLEINYSASFHSYFIAYR